jgi:ADP-ribosyl-[dinitrogen reductase] hydrolase
MRSKPVDIGNTVRRNLMLFRKTGVPVAPESDHDAGNGAAMRVLPVALATFGLPEDGGARSLPHPGPRHPQQPRLGCRLRVPDADGAGLSARGHPAAVYLPAHRAFGGEASGVVVRDRPPRENPSGWVVETLQAVLQALLRVAGFEDGLVDVVNRGGDADTTGAIAGMLFGARYGAVALPQRWLAALDPGIASRCREQARALLPALRN